MERTRRWSNQLGEMAGRVEIEMEVSRKSEELEEIAGRVGKAARSKRWKAVEQGESWEVEGTRRWRRQLGEMAGRVEKAVEVPGKSEELGEMAGSTESSEIKGAEAGKAEKQWSRAEGQ